MQTHSDLDIPEDDRLGKELHERARAMLDGKLSTITVGGPGEKSLWEVEAQGFLVRRMPDDKLALRVSVGGEKAVGPGRGYLTIRGEPSECLSLMRRAAEALEALIETDTSVRYVCSRCQRATYNPDDVRNEYCPCCGSAQLPKGCEHGTG